MKVGMKAKQIREIKPYRYFQMKPQDMENMADYEFVFSKESAYKINIYTGETTCFAYGALFEDYSKLVEGIPDEMDIFVDTNVYKLWLDTKDNKNDS